MLPVADLIQFKDEVISTGSGPGSNIRDGRDSKTVTRSLLPVTDFVDHRRPVCVRVRENRKLPAETGKMNVRSVHISTHRPQSSDVGRQELETFGTQVKPYVS